jgi:hypothetical protein
MIELIYPVPCIIKNITIVNDTSGVIRSDATICGITYAHHFDNSRGVIYAPIADPIKLLLNKIYSLFL